MPNIPFIDLKPISGLEKVNTFDPGSLLFAGADGILKRIDAEKFYQLLNNVAKPISPSDPSPTVVGWYKPQISSELDKPTDPNSTTDWGEKYPNAGNLRAKSGYDTLFWFGGGTTWKKAEVKLPSNSAKTVYDPTDNVNPSTMKAAADRWDKLLYVNKGFLENPSGYIDVKNYIDESIKGRETKEGIIIDLNVSSDYIFNVTTTGLQNIQIIPRIGAISNDIFNLKLVCELKPNIVFSDNIKFIGDQPPNFDSGFTYIIVFQTFDFGNTWFCSIVGAYSDKTKLLFNEQFKVGNITSLSSFNSNSIMSDGTKVTMSGAVTGDSVFYKDVGSPFYIVSATFGLVNARSKLVYKAIDNSNFGLIGYNGIPNKVSIIAVINGAVSENLTIDVPGMNDRSNVNFKVKVGLTTWKFYVNEVLVKTFNNPAGLPGATKVGIIADTNLRDVYVKQLSVSSNG
ncbi:hypothetical protein SAMN05421866_0037 [Chryseobacterium oranimense]|uniref:Uncharacterized protein n=1 Tax=Chryseobacterium oranimense TaxID=421058 RepID=A0A1M5X7X8_9FLAO|nr:hypothetical protein [Chryseobacterium oranimense]SHH95876.1 hypothetical protein SAMN05421866_0037 [Chryseobacterium oranimense]